MPEKLVLLAATILGIFNNILPVHSQENVFDHDSFY